MLKNQIPTIYHPKCVNENFLNNLSKSSFKLANDNHVFCA